MNPNRIALITGATAGIGREAARMFALHGYDVIIAARRAERLQQLAEELAETYQVRTLPLVMDVRNADAVASSLNALPQAWLPVHVLVNNAGLARGLGSVEQGLVSDWDEMIDTNIKGLLHVTRIVAGWMRTQGSGHIINVGSIAGKEIYPGGNVYTATKHAVDALTRGMRMDLVGTGVKVSAVNPGMVETEFSLVRFHGDADRAKQVYQGFTPLTPQDVAEAIWWMYSAPPHVNIADVLLLPADQASAMVAHRRPPIEGSE